MLLPPFFSKKEKLSILTYIYLQVINEFKTVTYALSAKFRKFM